MINSMFRQFHIDAARGSIYRVTRESLSYNTASYTSLLLVVQSTLH